MRFRYNLKWVRCISTRVTPPTPANGPELPETDADFDPLIDCPVPDFTGQSCGQGQGNITAGVGVAKRSGSRGPGLSPQAALGYATPASAVGDGLESGDGSLIGRGDAFTCRLDDPMLGQLAKSLWPGCDQCRFDRTSFSIRYQNAPLRWCGCCMSGWMSSMYFRVEMSRSTKTGVRAHGFWKRGDGRGAG